MNEQTNNASAMFMEVTSKKVETQDKKIAALEEQIKNAKDIEPLLQKLLTGVEEVRNSVNSNAIPVEKMTDLSSRLETNIRLLSRPLQSQISHHHHIPKIIWIAAGLFIGFALVCAGWYSTAGKLDQYIANDTKYRSLRLDTTKRALQSLLDYSDSLYNDNPNFRKIVLDVEERNRINFERLQRAERLKKEAKDLEKAVKEK